MLQLQHMAELLNGNIYVPADERRLASAKDIYQATSRLRPLMHSIFKTGGLLDLWTLGDPHIGDHDGMHSEQVVAGKVIVQTHAGRRDNAMYAAAEVGYLRHLPNVSQDTGHVLATFISTIREIALASSIHLNLPAVPAVTFDPITVPPPDNLLFVGVFEDYSVHPDVIQPLKTSVDYDDTITPLLMWKVDPYPGYWADATNSAASRLRLDQGDIIIKTSQNVSFQHCAHTVIFAQSDADDFAERLRSQYAAKT